MPRYVEQIVANTGLGTSSVKRWYFSPEPQILGEAARARTMIPLFVLPFTLLVVLASSDSGDLAVVCTV
jgi:hypothetical protein